MIKIIYILTISFLIGTDKSYEDFSLGQNNVIQDSNQKLISNGNLRILIKLDKVTIFNENTIHFGTLDNNIININYVLNLENDDMIDSKFHNIPIQQILN
ncbi:hypothetical protein OAQ99_04110 [Candidatus Kapabacteria bacterium]|nr:hypothetical protein [Candidatus Kapabacteria bacterium]